MGYIFNKTVMTRVREFLYRLEKTSIYPKFGYLSDALMGSVSKALMHELIKEVLARDIDKTLRGVATPAAERRWRLGRILRHRQVHTGAQQRLRDDMLACKRKTIVPTAPCLSTVC